MRAKDRRVVERRPPGCGPGLRPCHATGFTKTG
jgi:hypothetical protein